MEQQRLEGLMDTRPIKVVLALVEEDNYWFADFETVGACGVGISASVDGNKKPYGGKAQALEYIGRHTAFEESLFPFIRGYEIVETHNFKTMEEYIAWARKQCEVVE